VAGVKRCTAKWAWHWGDGSGVGGWDEPSYKCIAPKYRLTEQLKQLEQQHHQQKTTINAGGFRHST